MKIFKWTTTCVVASIAILSVVPLAAHAQWRQSNNGWLYSQGGSYATNWSKIDGQWYYFDSNGLMKTGWLKDNGNWYYLNEDGTMAHDTVIDGYYLNGNGTISSEQGSFSCH